MSLSKPLATLRLPEKSPEHTKSETKMDTSPRFTRQTHWRSFAK